MMSADDFRTAFYEELKRTGYTNLPRLRERFRDLGQETLDELQTELETYLLLYDVLGEPRQDGREAVVLQSFGHYVFDPDQQLLDHGGLNSIHRAIDIGFNRPLAVKVPLARLVNDPQVCAFLRREARITARLQHPNIVPVYEAGEYNGLFPFFSMKVVEGTTLLARLASRSTPVEGLTDLLGVFRQICGAIAFAHSEGVIHRDLKPNNVMVGRFGEVQVIDWGFARELTDNADEVPSRVRALFRVSHRFCTDSIFGTEAYMAPEQAGGPGECTRKTDVFGLGGILHHILTGRPVYVGHPPGELREMAQRCETDEALRRLQATRTDRDLIRLVEACLAKDQDARPTAADVESRVKAHLDRLQEAKVRAERRAKRAVAGLAVVLVVAIASAAGWLLHRQSEQQKTEALRIEMERAAETRQLQFEAEQRAATERERLERNAEAVASLIGQCEEALKTGDAEKADLAFTAAEKRAAEGGAQRLQRRLDRCRSALTQLRALDQIDSFRWVPVSGISPARSVVAERWKTAFATFGIVPESTPPADAAQRVTDSLVQDRLLTALDLWLVFSPSQHLLDILRLADPDDYRNSVRSAVLAGTGSAIRDLTERPVALDQPIRFVVALGALEQVSTDRRRTLLEKAAFSKTGDLAVLLGLGHSYPINQSEGALDRAQWYRAAVASHPRNAAAWQNLGIALHDKGDFDGAVAAYTEAIRLDPRSVSAHTNLGNALHGKGDLDGAIAAYNASIRICSKYTLAHYNLGNALADKGDFVGAIAAYEEAIRHDPKFVQAPTNLGIALKKKGDVAGAMAAYRRAIKCDPKFAPPHNNLGSALEGEGDLDGAIVEYKEAIRLDPKYGPAHNNLGLALEQKGDVTAAIAEYKEAIRHEPKDATPHNNLGVALMRRGDLAGALAEYKEAIRLDPKYITAHNNLGDILVALGDTEGAIRAYKEAIKRGSNSVTTHNNLGVALTKKGDAAGAIAVYQAALRIDPVHISLHNNLGLALKENGNLDGAIAVYKIALRLDPNHASTFHNLGTALYGKRDLDGALAAYKEVVRLEPSSARAHHNLGTALHGKRDFSGAIAAYKEAIRLDPAYVLSRNNLGAALRDNGDLDGAIAALKGALRLDPKYAPAHNNLGLALVKKGDRDGAIAAFQEVIRLNPGYVSAHNNLGAALEGAGDLDAALAAYKEAIRLDPQYALAHNSLGYVLAKKGDWDGAIAAFKAAATLNPTRSDYRKAWEWALKQKTERESRIAPPPRAVDR